MTLKTFSALLEEWKCFNSLVTEMTRMLFMSRLCMEKKSSGQIYVSMA